MAETTINIYLKNLDDSNEANPQDPGTTPNPSNPTENQGSLGGTVKKAGVFMAAAYAGKEALNFAMSSVGYATRDNLRQEQMNAGLKLGAFVAATIANPAVGLAMVGVDLLKSGLEYNRNVAQESLAVNINRERAGNMNRSRQ